MDKDVINKLKIDIENAEKFFDRTGEDIKDAYLCENEDIEKTNEYGIKNVFIYIPEANNDVYALSLN
jgi:hypothetical protein